MRAALGILVVRAAPGVPIVEATLGIPVARAALDVPGVAAVVDAVVVPSIEGLATGVLFATYSFTDGLIMFLTLAEVPTHGPDAFEEELAGTPAKLKVAVLGILVTTPDASIDFKHVLCYQYNSY